MENILEKDEKTVNVNKLIIKINYLQRQIKQHLDTIKVNILFSQDQKTIIDLNKKALQLAFQNDSSYVLHNNSTSPEADPTILQNSQLANINKSYQQENKFLSD